MASIASKFTRRPQSLLAFTSSEVTAVVSTIAAFVDVSALGIYDSKVNNKN